MTTIITPHGDELPIAPGETLYCVEGCGPDQYLTATSADNAALEAAEWQYGADGRHAVTVEWRGTGPGTALAEYEVRVDGAPGARRVVVYAETA